MAKSQKNIILISDNEELYQSFKRAFKAINNIGIVLYSGKFNRKHNVVMNIMENNNDIVPWLWGEFRKIALNPLVVLGAENDKSFKSKNPVFDVYSDEHAYFQLPFRLIDLCNEIHKLQPIYDIVTKRLIVDQYTYQFEFRLIDHDLKIIEGDRIATFNNFEMVREYYYNGDSDLVKFLDEKIQNINTKENWMDIASEVKEYLINRLKTKGA